MLAPLSWLRDYAPFDRPVEELAAALSDLGLVVEGVERVGQGLDGVVVARILDIRPHPNADKIRLVDVDAGDGEPLQIACGAWNMQVGDLVPLARIGAVLPGGMEIARRKMRGEWSNGMLCSPEEVGLAAVPGVDGLLILGPGSATAGQPMVDALGGEDVVFDLDVSPNRPDALCMAGVARDLAAALGMPFAWPEGTPAPGPATAAPPADPSVGSADVVVEAADLCPRFTATVLTGVRVGPSPAWLAQRLTRAGMRPIIGVVDVSNYVMLDVGQPNHAYDRDRLGGGGLLVRRARDGERLVTLDGATREVGPDDLLICDGAGTPVGVAGVMGGADSEIADTTATVLLEAAWFDPAAVARTGARLGLASEARHRFERGVDPEVTPRAVERFAQLLEAASGGGVRRGPTLDVRSDADLPAAPRVRVRTDRVNLVLGTALGDADIAALLAPLGFAVEPAGAGVAEVTVPSWRPDTTREIDVIEEVARLHGYRNIARRVPTGARRGGLTAYQRDRRRVRDALAGAGLDEAWTAAFLSAEDLRACGQPDFAAPGGAVAVTNPLDQAEPLLRPSRLPGLLRAVRFNADRQRPDAALFEIGRVFAPPRGGGDGPPVPVEAERLAVVVAGAEAPAAVRVWSVLAGALRLESVQLVAATRAGLHPTRTASLLAPGEPAPLGAVGEVDPEVLAAVGVAGRVAWLELDLDRLLHLPRAPAEARPVSRFPASDVDLALVVPEEVPAADVAATLRAATGALLEELALFDVFRGARLGAGRRSLGFRLRLRAPDRTLDDAELAATRSRAIEAVTAAHGAELRS
jgi:phenylalanyl-tRNA synthetase beta chain